MPITDPRRLPRRNHYQEGPGFLFVATQGGRPATGGDGSSVATVVRRRMRALRRWAESGSVAEACEAGGCGRATLFRWRDRFAAGGIVGLLDRPRSGDRSDLAPELEQAILMVRMLSYWNTRRISAEFRRRGIQVSHGQVDRLLARCGTNRTSLPRVPGPRYERASPNELWHIDIKGPFFLQRARGEYTKVWIVGLVDDHSRFLIGLRVLPRPRVAPILEWLDECVELCGVPLELMSDNGDPFVVWMPGVLTLFGKRLVDLRVRHLRTQVNSPWTNGKIERFWGVLQSELLDRQMLRTPEDADAALAEFSAYYDYHRLHGELDWATPAERYDGTPFTDQGFEHVPALSHLQDWLADLMAA